MSTATSGVKNFSDFNIETKRYFEGPKCYPDDILNQEFRAEFYEIRLSKKNDGSFCLYLQIIIAGEKRLLWSSSPFLMDPLKKLDEETDFPFDAKIIKVQRHFEFRGV